MCLLSALVHVLITNFVPGFGCGGKGPGNENENEKSEDYSKADLKKRVLFFITVFRLAIPAFFRLQMLLNLCRNDNIIKTENVAIEIV